MILLTISSIFSIVGSLIERTAASTLSASITIPASLELGIGPSYLKSSSLTSSGLSEFFFAVK